MQALAFDDDYLRLYASFDQHQRDALEKDHNIPVSSLTPAQQAMCYQITYQNLPGMNVKSAPAGAERREYIREPSQACPEGLPPDAFVHEWVQGGPCS
jgi:hypothetical protein